MTTKVIITTFWARRGYLQAPVTMALISLLASASPATLLTVIPISLLATILFIALRRVCFSAHSHIPGPLVNRLTPLWLWYHSWAGDEATQIQRLHRTYGPVVLVAPNEVDIADGAALAPIYTERGGFLKHDAYAKFYIEGVPTIFSALDPDHRKPRARAVVAMFATGAVYANASGIWEAAEKFVARLRREAEAEEEDGERGSPKVNVLNLGRCFALDSVTAYMFGKSYGGLDEDEGGAKKGEQLTASKFVDFFVAFGRFFYIPGRLFAWVSWACEKLYLTAADEASLAAIEDYTLSRVEESMSQLEKLKEAGNDSASRDFTYQGRLLAAGFGKHETVQQVKDLIFAGTDSTGMNVASVLWQLARNESAYARLVAEVQGAESSASGGGGLAGDAARIQTLPYLRAVVNEGLRLSLANPTRLPRIVPGSGWSWGGVAIPAGTGVGVGAQELHLNEAVFEAAGEFRPERWLEGQVTAEMQRDQVAFGVGARQCIARNLAYAELLVVVAAVAREDALRDMRAVGDSIGIWEWFNSKVPTESIEIERRTYDT